MAMPALQCFRRRFPERRIVLLSKPQLGALWRLHPAVHRVLPLEPGARGVWRAARALRTERCAEAYVLPHSIRSALPPFLARIPARMGLPGPGRRVLLTRVVPPRGGPGRERQVFEYMDLLAPDWNGSPPAPELRLPAEALAAVPRFFGDERAAWVGLIPGAARGPSKRWPAERFAEVGRRLAARRRVRVAVFGTASEAELCAGVARAIGPAALSAAGQTRLDEWAALLQTCRLVIANDSGGAHLAAAVGAPVVVLFGLTDPSRTAPWGARVRCLQAPGVAGRRDIAADDPRARAALEAISADEVFGAADDLFAESERRSGVLGP